MRISMPTLCLISIVNAAHTLHFGPVMVALWAALKIWQSIMSAQCAASLFTAVYCTFYTVFFFFFFCLLCFEKVWNALMWSPSVMEQPNACKCGAHSIIAKLLTTLTKANLVSTLETYLEIAQYFWCSRITEQHRWDWMRQLAEIRLANEWHARLKVNSHLRRAKAPNSQFTHTGPTS